MMVRIAWAGLALVIFGIFPKNAPAQELAPHLKPVKVVAPARIPVQTPKGMGELAVFASADLATPHPEITRAVLVIHGILRNADVYYHGALEARAAAGADGASSLMISPQFLNEDDAQGHDLGAGTLIWHRDGWTGGADSVSPAPVSSFAALDALLVALAEPALFPNLKTIIVAGHSGGGQVVQRYAVTGKGEEALRARAIHVAYVVANPSSYVYFNADRPGPDGKLSPFANAAACTKFNDWKYGFAAGMPSYVDQAAADYENRYAGRDVTYLLGTRDVDPNHSALDKSCMGEAEGPYRYARGHWYFDGMRARLGVRFVHVLHDVPGVGHEGNKMFNSVCGLAALFAAKGCQAE